MVRTGRGVAIHRSDCRTLTRKPEDADRWLDLGWNPAAKEAKAIARLQIMTTNQPGSLGSLSTVVGKQGGNITDVRFGSRSPDLYEIVLDIEVEDRDHLEPHRRQPARDPGRQPGRADPGVSAAAPLDRRTRSSSCFATAAPCWRATSCSPRGCTAPTTCNARGS